MITKQEVLENLDQIKNYIQEIENVKEKEKVNITIRNRRTNDIIWESQKTTYKEAVEEALKNKVNLSGANLSGANLSGANLSGVSLSWANLSWANLSGVSLSGANLSGANLSGANLSWANLSWANLSGVSLSGANLSGVSLSGADLSGVDLSGTLYYMGIGNRNFEALCKAIRTIKHQDGKFKDFDK
jgi:uncharacterized protein YjbI with pentapeptide repeats